MLLPTQQGAHSEVDEKIPELPVSLCAKFSSEITQNVLSKLQEKLPTGLPKHTSLCTVLGEMVPDLAIHAEKLKAYSIRRTVAVMDVVRERERDIKREQEMAASESKREGWKETRRERGQ